MPNSFIFRVAFWLTVALPSQAFSEGAIPISDCEVTGTYGMTAWNVDHRDIRGGFVMYEERYEGSPIAARDGLIVVANCFSGLTLKANYAGQDPEAMKGFVLAAAASSEKWDLPAIHSHFASLGVWTFLGVEKVEHCACAAFYPESKGRKRDWIARYAHPEF